MHWRRPVSVPSSVRYVRHMKAIVAALTRLGLCVLTLDQDSRRAMEATRLFPAEDLLVEEFM